MADVRTLATEMQKKVGSSRSIDELTALIDQYYDVNVRQSEAGHPWKEGIAKVKEAELGFFANLENGHFESNEIVGLYVDGNHVWIEVNTTAKFKGSPTPTVFHQVVEQQWENGKLVLERFWQERQKNH